MPKSDLLIHSGDIGMNLTTIDELSDFLKWFEKQPADRKIFIAGNHDALLDKKYAMRWKNTDSHLYETHTYLYDQATKLITEYDVVYLNNRDYVYKGLKVWGSPYSISFNRARWAFNADAGQEIKKEWSKIPSDVDILVTHTPCNGILDYYETDKGCNLGSIDLLNVIKKRLFNLELHCSGHIHDNYGIVHRRISNTRRCLFSNGAIMSNEYKETIKNPLTINL
ncbi:MAG TPA: metallophosphoesterase [Nitrososphaeraceae archaeon]